MRWLQLPTEVEMNSVFASQLLQGWTMWLQRASRIGGRSVRPATIVCGRTRIESTKV